MTVHWIMRITNGTQQVRNVCNYSWKLKIICSLTFRNTIDRFCAQFRAGILPLNIETGRNRNVSLPDQFCTSCDDSEVEDEIYFLCVCKFYSEYRSDMYNAVTRSYADFNHLDHFDYFVYLIANEQKHVISFIVKAFLKGKRAMCTS